MCTTPSSRMIAAAALALACLASPAANQELPLSGSFGFTFVYASAANGSVSQLYLLDVTQAQEPIAVGAPVAGVPSRWAHRRRTLGALETAVGWGSPLVLVTPFGDAVGTGALHLVDYRTGVPPTTALVATGNPAGYDVTLAASPKFVFAAEDTGAGTTLLRGYSYQAAGALTPLSPPTLTVPGAPSAYVSRMGLDEAGNRLWVPTSTGVQEVAFQAAAPQMALGSFHGTAPYAPTTNPTRIDRDGTANWILATSTFDLTHSPTEAGFLCWDDAGNTESGVFGAVPSDPTKNWIPAAGASELAIVGDGTDTYVYHLLREPPPGTFFIKGAAVGCVRFLGSAAADVGSVPCSNTVGEPFAIPSASDTRVAFETSFGPPFVSEPIDGGERVVVLYSPLDVLGQNTAYGELGVSAPLGGRISTKGMDRPIWSEDGSRVFAATSWFPGAPNPVMPGLEVLDVPASIALSEYTSPHTVVPTPNFPDRSIVHPSRFRPRFPSAASALFAGTTSVGHVAHDGMGSAMAFALGEVGQKQVEPVKLVQDTDIPNFPAVLPPFFDDAVSSLMPVPDALGARRTSFNAYEKFGVLGQVMFAADGDRILLQPTSYETFAQMGLVASVGRFELALPDGWVTTTEFFSL